MKAQRIFLSPKMEALFLRRTVEKDKKIDKRHQRWKFEKMFFHAKIYGTTKCICCGRKIIKNTDTQKMCLYCSFASRAFRGEKPPKIIVPDKFIEIMDTYHTIEGYHALHRDVTHDIYVYYKTGKRTRKCKNCGKRLGFDRRRDLMFCCTKCSVSFYSKKRFNADIEDIHTCPICKKQFSVSFKNRVFCSAKCKMHKSRETGRYPVDRVCPVCGNTFEAYHYKQIYCGKVCSYTARLKQRKIQYANRKAKK